MPKAYFAFDTTNVFATDVVKLSNWSKRNYQCKWYKNNVLISTNYNASYTHVLTNASDTIKLVVNNGTTSDSITRIQNFAITPPQISSFTPTTGQAGITVTISGFYFNRTTAVSFGNVPAVSFNVVNDNTITAVVAQGATGKIKVTTGYGSANSTADFIYIPPPTITSFTPVNGTVGTTITITGTNFVSGITASFGGVSSPLVTLVSPTTCTARVGNGASGFVKITTVAGTDSISGFNYFPTPTITKVNPAFGAPGSLLTITGTGFNGATIVTIGGVPVSAFTVNSPTSITAFAGAGTTGTVFVGNPAITVNSFIQFAFTNAPVISSFTPVSGPVGTQVTISGGNFNTNAASNIVFFGSVKATVLSATANSMVVEVPAGAAYQPISVTNAATSLSGFSDIPFTVTFPVDRSFTANSFRGRRNFVTDSIPWDFAVGDVDGDGKLDMVSGNYKNSTASVFRNTSSPQNINFASRVDVTGLPGIKRIQLNDIDGDGRLDIVFSASYAVGVPYTEYPLPRMAVLRNLSTVGNIAFDTLVILNNSVYNNYFAVADFDLDGKPDFATACDNCILNASGLFITIYRNASTPGNISMQYAGQHYVNAGNVSNNAVFSEMRVADFNNDKKPDILLGATTDYFFVLYENRCTPGNIQFLGMVLNQSASASSTRSPQVADYNDDGFQDFIVPNMIRRNLGNYNFQNIFNSSLNNTVGGFFVADLNGDGKPDYVSGPPPANSYSYNLFENTSNINNISFAPGVSYPTGITIPANGYNSSVARAGDFDGDGQPDIAFVNSYNNTISILRNNMGALTLCPGGNTSITNAVTGATYQWQQDAGSGFTNISNNANFSGVTTQTLQLTAIPSSWYGYKFRCVVNGVPGNVTTLQFSNTWTGAVSNAWENPANWSCGSVPDSFTDVIVNSGNIVISTSTTIRSLEIQSGVTLTVATGATLTILH